MSATNERETDMETCKFCSDEAPVFGTTGQCYECYKGWMDYQREKGE